MSGVRQRTTPGGGSRSHILVLITESPDARSDDDPHRAAGTFPRGPLPEPTRPDTGMIRQIVRDGAALLFMLAVLGAGASRAGAAPKRIDIVFQGKMKAVIQEPS